MTELRRKILDASIQLVAAQGVRALSFREVSRLANVSHQAPYHYFADHFAILRAIAQEGFAVLGGSMAEAAARHPDDSLAALNAAGLAYVDFALAHLGHFRVMFQRSLVDIHDPKAPLVEGAATFGVVVRLAAAAHADGYGRRLSADRLAVVCWSLVHGVATLVTEGILAGRVATGAKTPEATAHQVVAGLTALVGGERPRRPRKGRRPRRKA